MKLKKNVLICISIIILILIFVGCYIYAENEKKVAVFGYHGVLPSVNNTSGDNLIVDLETFEKQLQLLDRMGYKTMTLDEFYCWKEGKCKKNHKSVLITFDDGYINNFDYAYEVLKKYNMNAIVFCVGGFVEANDKLHMNKEKLEQMKIKYPNVEIASHSYNLHFHSDKKYEEVVNDINSMKEIVDTQYYAYPFGDYNDEYIKAIKDNNFKMAFTFGPKKEHRKADLSDDNYKIPRLNISKDMPMYKFILRLILPM